jgi:dipeptidyl aminopeptidase/acylaminoacyl peptidase
MLGHFPKRRSLALTALALSIGVLGWFVYSHALRSEVNAPRLAARPLPAVWADLRGAEQEYAIQDGTVIDGQNGPAAAQALPGEGGPGKVDALDIRQAYARAYGLAAQTSGKVFKDKITPHWFDGNTRFWYRNDLRGGDKEFILVDAEKGKRGPAFDHAKLAAALSKAAGKDYSARRLPFDSITFSDGLKKVRVSAGGVTWLCDLSTYECERAATQEEPIETTALSNDARLAATLVGLDGIATCCVLASSSSPVANTTREDETDPPELPDDDEEEPQQKKKKGFGKKGPPPPAATREARAPDGNWTALVKDNNVVLRDKDGKETQATTNGVAGNAFSAVAWSPDSKTVIAYRTEPGNAKEVYMIETSPKDQLHARLHTRVYERPGDKIPTHEMWLIPVTAPAAQRGEGAKGADPMPIKVDIERIDLGRPPRLRWNKERTHFTFEKIDRGHQRFRVVEVDGRTGKTRNIIDEVAETFIWTAHPPRTELMGVHVHYLDQSGEILYVSQRDGWKHLYLIDAKTGKIKNQITKGEWVVRKLDRIDEAKRQIWFRASGKNADQDPYLLHYYRVNFDGSGLVALTAGNGNHTIDYSPDGRYLIDTYSRVDLPPVHELRRVADGSLVCKLDEADVSALVATGWRAPEVFVAKGRDGKTDIWGIVCRPQQYDPNKKYPVIEYIYAGPHDSHVPKTFAAYRPMQALAELGFIVVQCDGMGTANRSRAFHDVCWKNLADAGFPDRILWIKALAKRYPYVDVNRVGIYGTSAGGQSSTGALLFHPEFYKVAVSSCGCHDNRLDKRSWNEQWMGLMGPHYAAQSNVTNAHKLQGKLLLIVGELDTNVPFESTMRVVDALIRARKDFDFIFVPGMGHSGGGTYGDRRRWDFFVRHLHGIEPPERNGQ